MPASHPRHSITETPALAEVLQRLRAAPRPDLAELHRIRHTTRQP